MFNIFKSGNRHKLALYVAGLILLAFCPACAVPKGGSSLDAKSFQLLEATQETTLPGRSETPPSTAYLFRIVWKSKTTSVSFFWRPDEKSWLKTDFARPVRHHGFVHGDPLLIMPDSASHLVHYGDTLILMTSLPDQKKAPMPAAVKKMPVKSLYFQTSAGSKWMYSPVAIKKLPDIVMP